MKPQFREAKATHLAALLLKMRGGKMSYLKLMKLMYLVDREALLRWGRPVTFDNFVSMDRGPVLSFTKNLLTEESPPGEDSVWRHFISAPQGWDVSLLDEPEFDELSRAEINLVQEIYQKFGHCNRWVVVNFTHDLPEWRNPKGSSLPIDYKEVLRAGGKPEHEIFEVLGDLEEEAVFEHMLSV